MRLNRFIGDFVFAEGKFIINDAEIAHQIRDVLQLRPGEWIELCDGKGTEAVTEIVASEKDSVHTHILQIKNSTKEPAVKVTLYCSILKKDNFELTAQKATEAGVYEITPILSDRTIKDSVRIDRVQKIIKEAAEQSGRGILPKLHNPISLHEAIVQSKQYDAQLFFDLSGTPFKDLDLASAKKAAIFIGPEGGWDDREVQLAGKEGLQLINLGALTLRSETAAVIATYLICRI